MATEVIIEEKAFMSIFLAAVEAYPSKFNGGRRRLRGSTPEGEAHGLLFGQRKRKHNGTTAFTVTLAVPNQIVLERTADGISVAYRHIEKIREAAELFPGYELLGFFHSHPYPKSEFRKTGSAEPSEIDKENALSVAKTEGKDMLDVIFAITQQERRTKTVAVTHKPHIIHSVVGVYKYTLGCYEVLDYYQSVNTVRTLNSISA